MTARPLPDSLRAFVAEAPVHRAAIAAEVIAAAGDVPSGAKVLDAGAGEAPYRPLFAHCEYLTQDWSSSPHPGARSADVIADLTALPLPDGEIDLVICTEVLEHVAAPSAALAELNRVLRPGGRLLLTVPFVVELHEEPYDFFRYTPYALKTMLRDASFTDVDVRPLTGWYSTLAHVLRHNGLATRSPQPRRRVRAAAFAALVLSDLLRRVAPTLDRLDERRALPLGWVATAQRADQT